jgi:hypothetical protein
MLCTKMGIKIILKHCWATMALDYISTIMIYVTWRQEHLWNVSVLQRVHLSNLLNIISLLSSGVPPVPFFNSFYQSVGTFRGVVELQPYSHPNTYQNNCIHMKRRLHHSPLKGRAPSTIGPVPTIHPLFFPSITKNQSTFCRIRYLKLPII